jgi:hypothetical protein
MDALELFCHRVWITVGNTDELHSWLVENMGEPFYRDQDEDLMVGKRWSIMTPIWGCRNIANLRVHFADQRDAMLFKLRWG